jgi:lipopolysaccharide/colanic/teichoic acid biosynthesis glycosyltransferase
MARPRGDDQGHALYVRQGKRALDLLLTILSSPVTAPLVLVGWVVARLSTRRPGFFTQPRVGRHGASFDIVKLRTMRPATAVDAQAHDLGVTAGARARITPAGAWLRRTKLDELPQLLNVLRGEMSLVGPRPDVPQWREAIARFPAALDVRPGITSLASLAYADEEEVLAATSDPIAAYRDTVLPHKLRLNELYARHVSPALDARILGLTALSVVDRDRAADGARHLIRRLGGNPEPG